MSESMDWVIVGLLVIALLVVVVHGIVDVWRSSMGGVPSTSPTPPPSSIEDNEWKIREDCLKCVRSLKCPPLTREDLELASDLERWLKTGEMPWKDNVE